jgi:hypothetical protein
LPRIVTIGCAAITLINFTIWTLICIIRGHLEQP